jgi:hypothetical protein
MTTTENPGVTAAFVRASLHDVTPAIPRALEATAGLFARRVVLCWDRTGTGLSTPS